MPHSYCCLLKDKEFLQSLNRFILASQSPRRADLLKFIIKDFTIQVSESEEIIDPRLNSQQLVMELAKGGELFNYIINKRRLNEQEASYFFYQIINGMEYLHKNNICHTL